LKYIRKE